MEQRKATEEKAARVSGASMTHRNSSSIHADMVPAVAVATAATTTDAVVVVIVMVAAGARTGAGANARRRPQVAMLLMGIG